MRSILARIGSVSKFAALALSLGGSLFAQSPVPTWSGSFTYGSQSWSFAMIGGNPSNGGTTTVPVYLIPVAITIGGTVFDATTTPIVNNVLASPIFCTPSGANQCTIDFKVGAALGQGIAGAMQAHTFSKGLRKYCAAHPGQDWHYFSRRDGHVLSSGHCPSDEDKALAAANQFISRHKDFIPGPDNSQAMTTYLASHKLDPRESKSYERAYKDLSKAGQLDLYAK